MYYLSKIVWFFLEPSNLLAFVALVSLLILRTRVIAVAALVVLLVAGLSPLGSLMLRPLEARFVAFTDDGLPVTGAIILGGAVDPEVTSLRGSIALNEAAERITTMLELGRRYPQARIVFTGGSGDLVGVISEADAIKQVIPKLAPGLQIIYERTSRNTVENAEMTRDLVQPKPGERWLLVTSAWHMPRAVGLFRRAGWNVTAYPVDYRTGGSASDLRPFTSVSSGLRRVDLASKEWIGLLFAYVTGKSATLFPAQ